MQKWVSPTISLRKLHRNKKKERLWNLPTSKINQCTYIHLVTLDGLFPVPSKAVLCILLCSARALNTFLLKDLVSSNIHCLFNVTMFSIYWTVPISTQPCWNLSQIKGSSLDPTMPSSHISFFAPICSKIIQEQSASTLSIPSPPIFFSLMLLELCFYSHPSSATALSKVTVGCQLAKSNGWI